MKRKIAALVVFIAIAVMSISGTMAYYTADSVATNVITAGNLDIELVEKEKTADGLKDFADKTGIMPGQEISKIVTVQNKGDNAAYVRILVDVAVKLADGTIEAGPDLITYDINTADWEYRDGYYYHKNKVEAHTETNPLFTTVTFSSAMGNEYQNCEATIDIEAYAVQVKNNGANVFEATGWPTKQADQQEQ